MNNGNVWARVAGRILGPWTASSGVTLFRTITQIFFLKDTTISLATSQTLNTLTLSLSPTFLMFFALYLKINYCLLSKAGIFHVM